MILTLNVLVKLKNNLILFTWNNDQLVFHKTQPTRVHKFERLFLFKSGAPAGKWNNSIKSRSWSTTKFLRNTASPTKANENYITIKFGKVKWFVNSQPTALTFLLHMQDDFITYIVRDTIIPQNTWLSQIAPPNVEPDSLSNKQNLLWKIRLSLSN